ncbi:2-keto-4-pentenoate hydratase [Lichenibacterium dinghuense]|uniref:2-keto-4-pentenoate hydratase n=1 Tax=Lichenibacterium dinghuense TaxID=2895977 RepID=UPI001F28E540|nr:fumarylacetoacetate hydrolase family protein [Lichenibacterium sp. 6Y81]
MTGMTPSQLRGASDALHAAWRDGRHMDALPAGFRPGSRADGYAVQALSEGWSAHPLRGWKIAATSEAGQRHINVDGPLAGRLLAERVFPEGRKVALGRNRMRVAEVEFVFRMGRSLPPRDEPYRADEILDAVAALHLGIEVPDSRYLDFVSTGAAQLIADNACADRFVLGPEVPGDWRAIDLAGHAVQGRVDAGPGAGAVHDGCGADVLGDPRVALAWIVGELGRHGTTLGAGQIVTTGTCVVPVPIAPGDAVTGDYGCLGALTVRFAA